MGLLLGKSMPLRVLEFLFSETAPNAHAAHPQLAYTAARRICNDSRRNMRISKTMSRIPIILVALLLSCPKPLSDVLHR
jgi:hypothetical protein